MRRIIALIILLSVYPLALLHDVILTFIIGLVWVNDKAGNFVDYIERAMLIYAADQLTPAERESCRKYQEAG